MIKTLHRWTRLTTLRLEDVWVERLRFVGSQRIAFLTWPRSRVLKIQAYCDLKTAQRLVRQFGGSMQELPANQAAAGPPSRRRPVSIRGTLKIFSDELSWREADTLHSKCAAILIPAEMAFGTGEHPTTASCLRLLADFSRKTEGFSLLDLGTGSGILSIAASRLGAARIEAIDYDQESVRTARRNAKLNGCRNISVRRGNALDLAGSETFDLVLANLFSEILIAAAPQIIRSLKPGGVLIFAGVLKSQITEVAAALRGAGLSQVEWKTSSKWIAGRCRRPS